MESFRSRAYAYAPAVVALALLAIEQKAAADTHENDSQVEAAADRMQALNQEVQAAYSPYKALVSKTNTLREQVAQLQKKAKTPSAREKLKLAQKELVDSERALLQAKANIAAKQQEYEKAEVIYLALVEVKVKERELEIARQKAGLKNLPVAEAQAATEKPAEKQTGILQSIGVGAATSLFSNGNRIVGLPGFFAKGELGILPNPKAALDIEAGYVPLAQQVASSPPFYLPRNPGERLEGGMIHIMAGVKGKIWNVLRGGVGVGAGFIWIEEGKDVGISRKPDEQGRRALANVPALLSLHPLARVELEIAFDIRDDISLAFGGRGMWTLSVLQTEAGEGDNDRVPLIDASAFATAQHHFH